MRLIFGYIFLLSLLSTAVANAKQTPPALVSDKAWLGRELVRLQLPKAFIKTALATYDEGSFNTVVSLNLLGFLQPPGQHMNHVNPQSVREATRFIEANQEAFEEARQRYQVPANVISSLLWIETRHGEDMGRFNTASVFMHLLQSDLNKNRQALIKLALEKNRKLQKYSSNDVRRLIAERTKSRKLWARDQLGALAVLAQKHRLDIKTLRGSYAGAFGMPQFIPSSYKDFAKGLDPKTPPDLTDEGDAIMSVAFYLAKHGWNNQNPEARIAALMKYNNSRDYADSILEISKRVQGSRTMVAEKSREVSSVLAAEPALEPGSAPGSAPNPGAPTTSAPVSAADTP